MSRENVERYCRALDAWNRGDVDYFLGLMSDDVGVSSALSGVEGPYRGHDGVRRWWQDFHAVFPDWQGEAQAVCALGDATVARLRLTGHGGGSGAPVDDTIWHVMHWRDGKAFRISRHDDERDALNAVGRGT